tara:strand:+ start:395 stop:1279 length:885 start_codon:yes stop_codon:yes gene_type:complete
MKITFGMIILNGDYVLEEALKSIYPYAHQILIAEGPVKYWQNQGMTTSTDRTNEIIDNFPDPENKITIVHDQYAEKDEQCNAYMQHLKEDTDYIWNLDSDEIFKPEDIEKLISILEEEKYTSVGFQSLTFYGGFDHQLTGFEENAEFIRVRKVYPGSYWKTHRPPTISHKYSGTKLPEKHLSYKTASSKYGIRMYHYSYVFPRQVHTKLKYYKESLNKAGCIDDYYNRIYYPWVTGDEKKKKSIENKFNGVHEFKPNLRGACRTVPFKGEHPKIIQQSMEKLKNQFDEELKVYK